MKPKSKSRHELNPCPFCGSIPRVVEDARFSWVRCENDSCMFIGPSSLSRLLAIVQWNTIRIVKTKP